MAEVVVEQCLCGDDIVCIRGEEDLGVRAHNETRTHRLWQAWGGMERVVHGPRPLVDDPRPWEPGKGGTDG